MAGGDPRSGAPGGAGDLGEGTDPSARAPEGAQNPPRPLPSSGEQAPPGGIPGAGSGFRPASKGRLRSTVGNVGRFMGLGLQLGADLEGASRILAPGLPTPMAWLGDGLSAAENLRQGMRPQPIEVGLGVEEGYGAIAKRRIAAYERTGKQGTCPADHRAAGLFYASMGRHDDALAACRRANEAGPDGLALFCMGYSLSCLGRDREACEAYEASMLHAPGSYTARVAHIALTVSKAALHSSNGSSGGMGPFVIVLGGGSTCGACGSPAGSPGHIGLGDSGVQDRLCCAIRDPAHLCCVLGMRDIRSFRLAKFTLAGLCLAAPALDLTFPFLVPFVSISRQVLERWLVGNPWHRQGAVEQAMRNSRRRQSHGIVGVAKKARSGASANVFVVTPMAKKTQPNNDRKGLPGPQTRAGVAIAAERYGGRPRSKKSSGLPEPEPASGHRRLRK